MNGGGSRLQGSTRRSRLGSAPTKRSRSAAGDAARRQGRFLTLGIDVAGMKCLVVGGGRVGTRKALTLAGHGAKVTVCSPRISRPLTLAALAGRLRWKAERYRTALLRGIQFVVAATDDEALNARISMEAEKRGILFCLASDRGRSKVIFPATCEAEGLVVSVHTNGQSPRRSAEMRDYVGRLLRAHVRRQIDCSDTPSPCESKPLRAGMVCIVGAGPGAADLITVRGLRAIRSADLVIYDRILGNDFAQQLGLDPTRSEIEWLGAGRMAPRRQVDINHRMLEASAQGKVVARVKNGDPFVFGRGGEEIDFLLAHGIAFEIIPGVSSALGTLTAAGYALTTRETGRSFAVTSAQLAGGELNEDYPRADSLVVLMAVGVLDEVARRLMSCGWSPETPAVIIERGTQAGEREVTGHLWNIARLASDHNIESPAILALGVVAARKYASARHAGMRQACDGGIETGAGGGP
jgi:uroporphyrin-III C-methyltransferase / precorrin-2 dehydrogenase / sirohydrochlorin ferrochelatase